MKDRAMAMRFKPTKDHPGLRRALEDAAKRWASMTWEEQEAELRAQRESWARQDKD